MINSSMNKKSILKTAGLKSTPARLRVLTLLEDGVCLSARDVWRALSENDDAASFPTVYRVLSVLSEAGLLRKIPSENGALYENANNDALPQLICSRCGKKEDVEDPALLRYNADVLKTRGLTEGNALLLYADCKRKECDEDR